MSNYYRAVLQTFYYKDREIMIMANTCRNRVSKSQDITFKLVSISACINKKYPLYSICMLIERVIDGKKKMEC